MGDMVTAKFHDSEISKSVDFNYSASSSIATLHALFDGMFNDVVNSFVVSGMVPIAAVPPSMNVVVPPGLAYSRVEDKLLHLGSNLTISVAPADPALDRIDTLEMRYFEIDLDQESRAFKDPTTGAISYSSVYTKKKSFVEIRCLEGVPGASVAPDTESGYTKLAEVVVPAGATQILDSNIHVITAQEDGLENATWTIEKSAAFSLGSIEYIKGSLIAHKNNNITSSNTVHGIRQGHTNGFDADLLDGQHGSFYQDAGNLNAGTIPLARLPSTLTGIDADTVDGYHHNQSLLITAAPQFSRIGIGMAADAGRAFSVTGDGYISGELSIGISESAGYKFRVFGAMLAGNISTGSFNTIGSTTSGGMFIVGHNAIASTVEPNVVMSILNSWYPSFIRMYYNQGICFHTGASLVNAGQRLYSIDGLPIASGVAERMRITSNGYVGINAIPTVGSGEDSAMLLINSNAGTVSNSALRAIYAGTESGMGEVSLLAHRNGLWNQIYASGEGSVINYSLAIDGTKPNYIKGDLAIGQAGSSGYKLLVVGNLRVTGNSILGNLWVLGLGTRVKTTGSLIGNSPANVYTIPSGTYYYIIGAMSMQIKDSGGNWINLEDKSGLIFSDGVNMRILGPTFGTEYYTLIKISG